jgi:hypothetical protein
MSEIKIVQDGCCSTRVFIDGKEIHGIRKMSFERDATAQDKVPVLKLDVIAANMTVDFPGVPELPDVLKPYYVKKESAS